MDDERDRELGAILKAAVGAQVGAPPLRITPRSPGLFASGFRSFAGAAAVLIVVLGGAGIGRSALARENALRNSLTFAKDILRESASVLYIEPAPPRGGDAEALAVFIDDLWAEPELAAPQQAIE